MSASILFIGRPSGRYLDVLNKHYTVITASSGKQAIAQDLGEVVVVVVVDAPSMRTKGEHMCKSLKLVYPVLPLVHIHPGPKKNAAKHADVLLFHPVSPRNLHKTVERLVANEQGEVVQCGPFQLQVERRILVAHGKATQLSPKQTDLLAVFLRQPGETISREKLMQTVWNTEYMGDTRTLNVHIRYLRQVLGDTNKPRYLQTVRGVGYCLSLEPEA